MCAVSSSDDSSGALLSVNMKTMATEVSLWLRASGEYNSILVSVLTPIFIRLNFQHLVLLDGGPEEVINAFGFNHNGQLVVTGDVGGTIKIYDIRSLTRIMEWSASSQSILSCTFSFDETSIYSVDAHGQLCQDSVHKPGHRLDSYPLQGFTSSTLSSAMMLASSSSTSVRSAGGGSIRSKSFMRTVSSGPTSVGGVNAGPVNTGGAHIPRIQLESSGGTIATVENAGENAGGVSGAGVAGQAGAGTATSITTASSSNSTTATVQPASSISRTSANGSGAKESKSALTTMNIGPGQLLGWSADTDHLVMGCGNAGVLVQVTVKNRKYVDLFTQRSGTIESNCFCLFCPMLIDKFRTASAATFGPLSSSDVCGLVTSSGCVPDGIGGRHHSNQQAYASMINRLKLSECFKNVFIL